MIAHIAYFAQFLGGVFMKLYKRTGREQINKVMNESYFFYAGEFLMLFLWEIRTEKYRRSCSYEKNDIRPLLLQPRLYAR